MAFRTSYIVFFVYLQTFSINGQTFTAESSQMLSNQTTIIMNDKTTTTGLPWSDCYRLNCSCELGLAGWSAECNGKGITSLPQDLPTNITILRLRQTNIAVLHESALQNYVNLRKVVIDQDEALHTIEPFAFYHPKELQLLEITNCFYLTEMPAGVLSTFKKLTHLTITGTGLTDIPNMQIFQADHGLTEINLSNNQNIKSIGNLTFDRLITYNLKITRTGLKKIEDGAFNKASIARLFLSENKHLEDIGKNAFQGVKELKFLNLSSTPIKTLPTNGLDTLSHLYLKNTPSLRRIPPVVTFLDIKVAEVTYPHHCCAFKNPEKQNPQAWQEYLELRERIDRECAKTTTSMPSLRTITSQVNYVVRRDTGHSLPPMRYRRQGSVGFGGFGDPRNPGGFQDDGFGDGGFGPGFGTLQPPPGSQATSPPLVITPVTDGNIFHNVTIAVNGQVDINCGELIFRKYDRNVNCTPEPNAWNPCEDVLGYMWLRVIIWVVLLAALLGNMAVIIVILSNRNKMTVPKFLMCNLAFADFMMGLYLLIIASIDADTLGEYFNYAVHWQNEGGCQVAGFITVFASELSVFTLTVITLERWYAISHAINLTKRLRLREAAMLMSAGWGFTIMMSALPVTSVISSYSTTSICLPFKFDTPVDQGYVIFLIIINGLAFIAVCACYISMFIQVYGNSVTAPGSDATIAKRMAILVFTDFACYAPIAFFALTAAGGLVLINITNSKILLVLFYPLNSCANPFLYAIFTKQFRKDLFMMLSRNGICKKRAAKYKETYASGPGSMSQSRNSMPLNHVRHHPSDGSILTQYTTDYHPARGSRPSIHNSPRNSPVSTPQHTPKLTPKGTPKNAHRISPRSSPKPNGLYRPHSESITSTNSGCSSVSTPPRKLSIVPETSTPSEDGDKLISNKFMLDRNINSHLESPKSTNSRNERFFSTESDGIFLDNDEDYNKKCSYSSRIRSASQYGENNNDHYISNIDDNAFEPNRLTSQNTDTSILSNDSICTCNDLQENGQRSKVESQIHQGSDSTMCYPQMIKLPNGHTYNNFNREERVTFL